MCGSSQIWPEFHRQTYHRSPWLMSFFSHVRPRRTAAMVKKLVRDLESGLYATPKSFDALARYRTEQLKLDRSRDLLRITYPENALISEFYARYPQAKTSPLVLNSFAPPLAKVFALRQLHLMQSSKLDAATAFARVEQEMKPQLAALTQQALGTNIPQLQLSQQEEEQRLRDAAAAVAEGQLPVSR